VYLPYTSCVYFCDLVLILFYFLGTYIYYINVRNIGHRTKNEDNQNKNNNKIYEKHGSHHKNRVCAEVHANGKQFLFLIR